MPQSTRLSMAARHDIVVLGQQQRELSPTHHCCHLMHPALTGNKRKQKETKENKRKQKETKGNKRKQKETKGNKTINQCLNNV